jgi:hypothetical protein
MLITGTTNPSSAPPPPNVHFGMENRLFSWKLLLARVLLQSQEAAFRQYSCDGQAPPLLFDLLAGAFSTRLGNRHISADLEKEMWRLVDTLQHPLPGNPLNLG